MKKRILGLLVLVNLGCFPQNSKEDATPQTSIPKSSAKVEVTVPKKDIFVRNLEEFKLPSDAEKSYVLVKKLIKEERVRLSKEPLPIDSLSKIFTTSLLNRIIPFWEGTEWSFEGHSAIPKQGHIACGYFVSTTLKDIGLNVNRYQLAQQGPNNEARSLAVGTEVKIVSEKSVKSNIEKIKRILEAGIHFIGFDAHHVGYLLKEKDQLYVIHSNYMDARGVEIEKIEASTVFSSCERFYIVELSTNKALLRSWVEGIEIEVIK